MKTRFVSLLVAAVAALLVAGCDGEKVDYEDQASLWNRYDILWAWAGGSDAFNLKGEYGTAGTAAASNLPGSRSSAMRWTDTTGKLWLFGGEGYDSAGNKGVLNDLWRFDPATGLWTFVGGSTLADQGGTYAGATPWPGGRKGGMTWVDTAGTVWLFGGDGYDGSANDGRLNDLWTFDGAQWAFVGGGTGVDAGGTYGTQGTPDVANWPGARHAGQGWVDPADDSLWLFGGSGYDGDTTAACCFLNDLWRYDTVAGTWTWKAGSKLHDPEPVYGTQGDAAAANTPAGLTDASVVVDSNGDAWLYGGRGNAPSAPFVSAELWKHTDTGWAWMYGTQRATVEPVHASRGIASFTANPGSRTGATAWHKDGLLWLYGGEVHDAAVTTGGIYPNDLWAFNGLAWTWVGGSDAENLGGTYRNPGQPGGRRGGAGWVVGDNELWLFGGDAAGNLRNDLWRFPR